MNTCMHAPKPFTQPSPHILRIREGGGCLSIFGLPFLAAGVFATLVGIKVIPMGNAAQVPGWGWQVIFLLGLVFVAVGGHLVFARRWTTLDKAQGVVRKEWGLVIPMRVEQLNLIDFDAVVLRFIEGDSDTADRYPVSLKGKAPGRTDLMLSSPTEFGEAYDQAGFIANFLHMPMVDSSTDHETVVESDKLNVILSERQIHPSLNDEKVLKPVDMKSQVYDTGTKAVRVIIPRPGFRSTVILGLVIPVSVLVIGIPYLLEFFQATKTPGYVQSFFIGFLGLFFGLVPLFSSINSIILAKRGRTVVIASPEGITIEEQAAWSKKQTHIAAVDIVGLDYSTVEASLQSITRSVKHRYYQSRPERAQGVETSAPAPKWLNFLQRVSKSKGVIVKSKKGLFTFGAGLSDDEVTYLHWRVRQAVTS